MLTIVTGQARTGTSLTMRLLDRGGVTAEHKPHVNDRLNPYGSFETDKRIPLIADGKSVKCLNPTQLFDLPARDYKLIMPVRDPEQIILSRWDAFNIPNRPMNLPLQIEMIEKHYRFIRFIASNRDDMTLLEIPYADYFEKTDETVANIAEFLGVESFNIEAAKTAIDPSLYKVRTTEAA